VNGVTANTGSDATQVSISQENQNTFWTTLETELKGMIREGDTLVLNRFSGVAQITAPVRRHETIRAFIDLVNRRITQQVEHERRHRQDHHREHQHDEQRHAEGGAQDGLRAGQWLDLCLFHLVLHLY
jgi:hypothetical protein